MNPFLETQIGTLIENLRLIEAFVIAPLGLHSDIKMVRQALPFDQAADLDRTALGARRAAYQNLSHNPGEVVLQVALQVGRTLDILESVKDSPLNTEWVSRARRVLARVEQKIAGDLRAETAARVRGLYVIVDPDATNGRPVIEVAEAVLAGGAAIIQLRDKTNDRGEVLPIAREIRALCGKHDALFFMNDDPSVAFASEAHGLHVGQSDYPVPEARRILRPTQLVGRSNNTMVEVADSVSLGADYVAVGAVFPTATVGKGTRSTVGLEAINQAKDISPHPIVAIGGINTSNVAEVIEAGADCVAVISAVTMAEQPETAARQLADAIESARS